MVAAVGVACPSPEFSKVGSYETRLKKLIMIIIIIIMNESQELMIFHGRQKLTSTMN